VHPSLPAHSVADLIKVARDAPGKIQYGSPSTGTVNHLAAELFASMADIKLGHIPYKGTGPAMSDLLGGHISMMFAPIPAAHANVAAGTLRALGVSSLQRSRLLPEIPTIAEAGLPGFEATQRSTLLAPAGTPRPIVERLNRELNALLATATRCESGSRWKAPSRSRAPRRNTWPISIARRNDGRSSCMRSA
jgi:tripartite-type tricarboxylate transporter receptor subunit TctC